MEKDIGPIFIRENNWFFKMIRTKSFWIIFWSFLFSYPIYRSLHRTLPPPLPVYHLIPEFTLTNEFNRPFGSKDLKGRFYIANFMSTNCPTCNALMDKMDIIQNRIRGIGTKGAIVSFTVDPLVDKPDILFKYARKRNTNPFIWNFLTGKMSDLQKIILNGFKIPIGKNNKRPITLNDVVRADKLVLVDDKGQVRGYYSIEKSDIDRLMIDLGLLVNNSFSPPKK